MKKKLFLTKSKQLWPFFLSGSVTANGMFFFLFFASVFWVIGGIAYAKQPIEETAGGIRKVVSTIADLRALDAGTKNANVFVRGYHTEGDGGGGIFWFDKAATECDNQGTVILPDILDKAETGCNNQEAVISLDNHDSSKPGRWRRFIENDGVVSVKWFGAKGDKVSNDLRSIQAAIKAVPIGGTVIFPRPSVAYRVYSDPGTKDLPPIEMPIIISKSLTLRGEGAQRSSADDSIASIKITYVNYKNKKYILADDQPLIRILGDNSGENNWNIPGRIVNFDTLQLEGGSHGIQVHAVLNEGSRFRNLLIQRSQKAGIHFVSGESGMIGAQFENIFIQGGDNRTEYGILAENTAGYNHTRWVNLRIGGTLKAAVRLKNPVVGPTHPMYFEAPWIEVNHGYGFEIEGGHEIFIYNAHFEQNGLTTGDPDIYMGALDMAAPAMNHVFLHGGIFSTASHAQDRNGGRTPSGEPIPTRITFSSHHTRLHFFGTPRIGGRIDGGNNMFGSRIYGLMMQAVPEIVNWNCGATLFWPQDAAEGQGTSCVNK